MKHALILGALVWAVASGCAKTTIRHVSAERFVQEARKMEQINSAHTHIYVGTTATRVYLEHVALVPRQKTTVYCTELGGLPTELQKQLKAGPPPWTPWQERKAAEEQP